MKKLLKTLYVLTPDSYLFTRNENICVKIGDAEKLNIPALNIDSIVCFGKMTVRWSSCARASVLLRRMESSGTVILRWEDMKNKAPSGMVV